MTKISEIKQINENTTPCQNNSILEIEEYIEFYDLKTWAREHIKELINKNQKWLDNKDICIYCNKNCFDISDDCTCFEENDAIITWIKKNILEVKE